MKNYSPISLLSIFGRVFEGIIFNSLFNHFLSNKLFMPSQSGFVSGDSSIAQLLSIMHEIKTAVVTKEVTWDIFESTIFHKISATNYSFHLK